MRLKCKQPPGRYRAASEPISKKENLWEICGGYNPTRFRDLPCEFFMWIRRHHRGRHAACRDDECASQTGAPQEA